MRFLQEVSQETLHMLQRIYKTVVIIVGCGSFRTIAKWYHYRNLGVINPCCGGCSVVDMDDH